MKYFKLVSKAFFVFNAGEVGACNPIMRKCFRVVRRGSTEAVKRVEYPGPVLQVSTSTVQFMRHEVQSQCLTSL
jgi:hypothetical protein